MDKIIGRELEYEKITTYMNSGRAEFVAIYGRRRVGKTFLVRKYFNDKFDFSTTGVIDGTREEELSVFYNSLCDYGYTGKQPQNWIESFYALYNILKAKKRRKRCVVFIDELPCFDTQHSGFVRAFGHFWNNYASKLRNIFLVVCGSATSWIVRNIIDNRGGLHNRITHEMHIHPFNLHETELFFKTHRARWTQLAITQMYMAIGGVPYYLEMIDFGRSVAENIDALFFAPDAELRNEYDRLFKSLYRHPDKYMEIIALLSGNKSGLTRKEISDRLKVNSGSHLSNMLEDLVNCDFLRRYSNGTKRNSCIYQVVDFYTLFYHQFCKKKSSDKQLWQHSINTPRQNTWYGLAFERICLCHVGQILYALHLDTVRTEYFSWRSSTSPEKAQIDLVIDRVGGQTCICEIKYSQGEYSITREEETKIRNRITSYDTEMKPKNGVIGVLITTFGLANKQSTDSIQHIVTLNKLFE
ncbi:MAG: ATP-binding protein [Bacteroidales bacterium]|nr:ATP-binding protein [Bacteroidales bacterium]